MRLIPYEYASELTELMKQVPKDTPFYIVEYAYIAAILKRTDGNRTWTAKEMGISVRALRHKLKEMEHYGFEVPLAQAGRKKGMVKKRFSLFKFFR